MSFAAHIVTRDTGTAPEVAVTTTNDHTGVAEPIISYELSADARVADAVELLQIQGWSLHGVRRYMEPGYWIVQLHATDWAHIVRDVTYARKTAEIQHQCCETAWRTVLDDARRDERTDETVIADIAGIGHEQCQGIRDQRGAASRLALP